MFILFLYNWQICTHAHNQSVITKAHIKKNKKKNNNNNKNKTWQFFQFSRAVVFSLSTGKVFHSPVDTTYWILFKLWSQARQIRVNHFLLQAFLRRVVFFLHVLSQSHLYSQENVKRCWRGTLVGWVVMTSGFQSLDPVLERTSLQNDTLTFK